MGLKRTLFRIMIVQPMVSFVQILDWVLYRVGLADVMATKTELMHVFSNEVKPVPGSRFPFGFFVPSAMAYHRAKNALRKEPETIAWIDSFDPGAVFWDVGANVGVYSIYALLRHPDMEVVAFEPAVSNIYSLTRNIELNGVSDRFTLVPLPLTETTGIGMMSMSSEEVGGALNTFGVSYDWTGAQICSVALSYRTLGVCADDYVVLAQGRTPNYVKIDVDGIEHLVLSGMKAILASSALKAVLVEINEEFVEHKDRCLSILSHHGFECVKKRHDPVFMAAGVSNFIFERVPSTEVLAT